MYCSCHEDQPVTNFDVINPIDTIPMIVNRINSFTEDYRSKCAEYSIDSIKKLSLRTLSSTDTEYKLGDSHIYVIQLILNPGNALFETVLRSFDKNSRFEIIDKIIRINLYGNQSHCLNDKILKNYCYCNDLLGKSS